jgi:hypothetical protein
MRQKPILQRRTSFNRQAVKSHKNFCGRFTPGRRSSYQKNITILGYPVKPEKRLWSCTRRIE